MYEGFKIVKKLILLLFLGCSAGADYQPVPVLAGTSILIDGNTCYQLDKLITAKCDLSQSQRPPVGFSKVVLCAVSEHPQNCQQIVVAPRILKCGYTENRWCVLRCPTPDEEFGTPDNPTVYNNCPEGQP